MRAQVRPRVRALVREPVPLELGEIQEALVAAGERAPIRAVAVRQLMASELRDGVERLPAPGLVARVRALALVDLSLGGGAVAGPREAGPVVRRRRKRRGLSRLIHHAAGDAVVVAVQPEPRRERERSLPRQRLRGRVHESQQVAAAARAAEIRRAMIGRAARRVRMRQRVHERELAQVGPAAGRREEEDDRSLVRHRLLLRVFRVFLLAGAGVGARGGFGLVRRARRSRVFALLGGRRRRGLLLRERRGAAPRAVVLALPRPRGVSAAAGLGRFRRGGGVRARARVVADAAADGAPGVVQRGRVDASLLQPRVPTRVASHAPQDAARGSDEPEARGRVLRGRDDDDVGHPAEDPARRIDCAGRAI
eukprot:29442-Pelagococcus_subviridis.AAC.8